MQATSDAHQTSSQYLSIVVPCAAEHYIETHTGPILLHAIHLSAIHLLLLSVPYEVKPSNVTFALLVSPTGVTPRDIILSLLLVRLLVIRA